MKGESMMRHTRFAILSCLAFACATIYSGCTVKEPCGSNQEEVLGLCRDIAEGTGGSDGTGGETSEGGAGGDTGTAEPNFGAACTAQSDCTGGLVCGEPQLPKCLAQCGEGDPFEGMCPPDTNCAEAIPGVFICL